MSVQNDESWVQWWWRKAGERLAKRDKYRFRAIYGQAPPELRQYVNEKGNHFEEYLLPRIYRVVDRMPSLKKAMLKDKEGRVAAAIIFTFAAFESIPQHRKNNKKEPIIVHSMRVADATANLLPRETNSIIKAILHDVMEDRGVAKDQLAPIFGGEVADGVDRLSLPPDKILAEKYPPADLQSRYGKETGIDFATLPAWHLLLWQKRAYKDLVQTNHFKWDEVIIKAADNIDNLSSDTLNLQRGIYTPSKDNVRIRIPFRDHYHQTYLDRMKGSPEVAAKLDDRFKASVAVMQKFLDGEPVRIGYGPWQKFMAARLQW